MRKQNLKHKKNDTTFLYEIVIFIRQLILFINLILTISCTVEMFYSIVTTFDSQLLILCKQLSSDTSSTTINKHKNTSLNV